MLKKNGVQLTVIVILIGLAYLTALNVFRDLVIIVILSIALGYIQIFCGKRWLKIEWHVEQNQIEKGKELVINLKLTNQSILPAPYIMITLEDQKHLIVKSEKRLCVLLDAMETKVIPLNYEAQYIGRENLKIKEIVLWDYFRQISYDMKLEEVEVMILPRVEMIETIAPRMCYTNHSYLTHQSEVLNQIPEEIGYELEDYHIGDNEKLIHWKLLMQKGKWLVRKREGYNGPSKQITIVVDAIKCNDEVYSVKVQDHLLESTMSLIAANLEIGYRMKLLIYQKAGWINIDISHKHEIGKVAYELGQCTFVSREILLNKRIPEDIIHSLLASKEEVWLISHMVDEKLSEWVYQMESDGAFIHVIEVVSGKLEQVRTHRSLLKGDYWQVDEAYHLIRTS